MLEKMPENKLKRMIVGVTIAGTLLLVVLFSVIIYQFVSMGVKSHQIDKMQEEIESFEQIKDKLGEDLEWYTTDEYKEWIARTHGYVYPEDQVSGTNETNDESGENK